MRIKLILALQTQPWGNVLPVSYQYELASCIHRRILESPHYKEWLSTNGFTHDLIEQVRLFTISNLYIPKVLVREDRLNILAKHVQLWISFLPSRGVQELIQHTLLGQELLIGDRVSRVLFFVSDAILCPNIEFKPKMNYITLSPIVLYEQRVDGTVEYLTPENKNYLPVLIEGIKKRYETLYGKIPTEETLPEFELLSPIKRKGIFIKRFTPLENKVIGYMMKFCLTADQWIHELMYHIGAGERIGLGFGSVEILNTQPISVKKGENGK